MPRFPDEPIAIWIHLGVVPVYRSYHVIPCHTLSHTQKITWPWLDHVTEHILVLPFGKTQILGQVFRSRPCNLTMCDMLHPSTSPHFKFLGKLQTLGTSKTGKLVNSPYIAEDFPYVICISICMYDINMYIHHCIYSGVILCDSLACQANDDARTGIKSLRCKQS